MRLYLGKIRNVIDVIAGASRIYILVLHRHARDFAYRVEVFKDRNLVLSSTPDVANFCRARGRDKAFDESGDIDAMNVIANLLSLITKNTVHPPFEVALH